jgi:indole-3-glycerol phosphate synthase
MHGERRFSQAIAEGDGISIVAEAEDSADAARAAADGARALAARRDLGALDPPLPVLWRGGGRPEEARRSGADAWVLVAETVGGDDDRLDRLYAEVLELGLDCVVEVGDEEELERVLERLDPEVFLLTSRRAAADDPLDFVLELLHDVPAGKLAVAEFEGVDGETLAELERAGFDAVIVPAAALADLPGASA